MTDEAFVTRVRDYVDAESVARRLGLEAVYTVVMLAAVVAFVNVFAPNTTPTDPQAVLGELVDLAVFFLLPVRATFAGADSLRSVTEIPALSASEAVTETLPPWALTGLRYLGAVLRRSVFEIGLILAAGFASTVFGTFLYGPTPFPTTPVQWAGYVFGLAVVLAFPARLGLLSARLTLRELNELRTSRGAEQ